MIRAFLLFLFRRIARIYFRSIEVAGQIPGETTGGRLFAANHVNGLVDPILVLTQAPCIISPVAKSTLWKIPGLSFLLDAVAAVPIVRRRDVPDKSESDNEAVFSKVASHLGAGGNILIFPEGTSHNEPHLLALRSGAGRMLARASETADALTFQTVALEFDARDSFRSRALVLFGPIRSVAETGASAEAITEQIRLDLSELLVEGASWDERMLVVRLAEMLANDDPSLEHVNVIGRRIEAARRILVDSSPADVHAMEEALRAYVSRLEEEDATDEDVVRSGEPGHVPDVARVGSLIATLPFAAFAAVVYWVPYQLPRFVTNRLRGDPDERSTYKLGVGLVAYPVWAAAAIALVFAFLPVDRAALLTVLLLVSPFAALRWLDHWDRIPRLLATSEEKRERLASLAAERAAIVARLDLLRAKVGA
jgi:glycerol-3-phosphate O-acyltransferase / dihydroxyacetone phosphate acyltransferase